MNATFCSRTALVFSVIALLSACGGSKQSPETRQYLQQVTAAIDQLNRDLSAETAPKVPQLPSFLTEETAADARALKQFNSDLSRETTPKAPEKPRILKAETVADKEALKQFSSDLLAYYTAAGKTTDRVVAICDRVQSKIRGIDSAGADAAAVELCDRYLGLTDRRQQLAVNLAAFIFEQQSELAAGRVSRYASRLLAAGIATLLAPTSGKTLENDFKPTPEEDSEMSSRARSVQDAIKQWRSDAASITAARSDLLTTLEARYPGDAWNFLAAK